MGKAIAIKTGTVKKQANYRRINKPSNGNKREKVEGWDEKTQTTDSNNQQWGLLKNPKKESDSQRVGTIKLTGGVNPTMRMLKE